ncbi:hypothetical protein BGZ83_010780 [Gryganskiella cystojenkinii]|nr:hypothetical protein BGZ83_010780 [Gryganskiella cystojenkinii]
MRVKTLALVAVAVAATTILAYDNNPCSTCVFSSVFMDINCVALPEASQSQLKGLFGPTLMNNTLLASLAQDPAIKSCLCHWTSTALTSNGSAASCLSGVTPVCNSTQMSGLQVYIEIANMVRVVQCVPTGSTTGPSGPITTVPNTANVNTVKTSTGAIIGGVVGGLVIVVVVVSYLIYKRRKSKMTVNNTQSQKLEAHEQDDGHPSQNIQVLRSQNPSLPPMSQAPVFQQQFVFSTHPKPNVSAYMSASQQQQQQQTVPSIEMSLLMLLLLNLLYL